MFRCPLREFRGFQKSCFSFRHRQHSNEPSLVDVVIGAQLQFASVTSLYLPQKGGLSNRTQGLSSPHPNGFDESPLSPRTITLVFEILRLATGCTPQYGCRNPTCAKRGLLIYSVATANSGAWSRQVNSLRCWG